MVQVVFAARVGDVEIQIAVVIEITPDRAPAVHGVRTRHVEAAAGFLEPAVGIDVKAVPFTEVSDVKIQVLVVVEIPPTRAEGRTAQSKFLQPRLRRGVHEAPRVVPKEPIRPAVGEKEVRVAIAVVIRPRGLQAAVGVVQAGFFCGFDEAASLIEIEAVFAEVGYVEVGVAVSLHVGPRRAVPVSSVIYACLCRDFGEAASVVPIEPVRLTEIGHVEVQVAVAVDIRPGRRAAVAVIRHANPPGKLRKPVAVVPVEQIGLQAPHHVEVRVAIAVVIRPCGAEAGARVRRTAVARNVEKSAGPGFPAEALKGDFQFRFVRIVTEKSEYRPL